MTNPIDYPLADNSLINLADASRFDEIFAYALAIADEIIADARSHNSTRIAESINIELIESASFTDLPCDPELLHLMLETIIATRLDCLPSQIAADF